MCPSPPKPPKVVPPKVAPVEPEKQVMPIVPTQQTTESLQIQTDEAGKDGKVKESQARKAKRKQMRRRGTGTFSKKEQKAPTQQPAAGQTPVSQGGGTPTTGGATGSGGVSTGVGTGTKPKK